MMMVNRHWSWHLNEGGDWGSVRDLIGFAFLSFFLSLFLSVDDGPSAHLHEGSDRGGV